MRICKSWSSLKSIFNMRLRGIAFDVIFLLLAFVCILQISGCATMEAGSFIINGDSYMKKGQYDKAISEYAKAIEIDPKYAEAYKGRGSGYTMKRQYNKAIEDLNKAIQLEPVNAEAKYYRGLAYAKTGQYDKAISDFSKCIEIVQNRPASYSYTFKTSPGQTITPKYFSSPSPYYMRGYIYLMRKEYDKALPDINKAIDLHHPNRAGAHNARALIWHGKCQYDKAISDSTKAIEIDPKLAMAYVTRGNAFKKIGQIEKACADWKKACALGRCYKYNNAKSRGACE